MGAPATTGVRCARGRLRTVALIGIDGSGKTTQAYRLAESLTAAGLPATYHRNAGGRRWLGRAAHRLGRPDAQSLLGRDGMLLAESVLRWLAIAMTLVGGLFSGRVAVMDRYAACQYASLRAHDGHRWERLVRAAYRLFPRPQVTFLLTVEPIEAYRRIERRGTDHESLGFLAAADLAYRTLPEYPTFVPVNADLPAEEIAREIRGHLNAWLAAGGEPTDVAAPVTELVPLQARP
ncbi:dTMP kinase [Verrucosispora sp. WMMD703]|uniref:dTMP kinase n=1 Tax=unclassified Micromonospora TaxID=2617518 RepID=UPI00249BB6DC|nr:thymidylate kinase [Verrucosispora sp. WMMD1129]WFE48682.1 thymidylate kinase [Verrucosispora sp. WMMD1129]